jgi:hypothetical protein
MTDTPGAGDEIDENLSYKRRRSAAQLCICPKCSQRLSAERSAEPSAPLLVLLDPSSFLTWTIVSMTWTGLIAPILNTGLE